VRLLVGAAVACVATSLVGIVLHYCEVPYLDEWDGHVAFVDALATGDLEAWWRPHNEHRIVLARVLFWLDAACGGRLLLPLIASPLLAAASAALLSRALRAQLPVDDDRPLRRSLTAIVVTALFSWVQGANFAQGFQVQFFFAQVLPLLGLLLLAGARTAARPRTFVALAAACGVLSLGTMANGITALPVFAVAAAAMHHGRRTVGVFVAAAIAGAALYFHAFAFTTLRAGHWLEMLAQPVGLARFVCGFLGSPCYAPMRFSGRAAEIAGLVYLLLLVAALRGVWGRGRGAVAVAMVAFAGNVVLAAIAAGCARFGASPDVEFSSRYTTSALTGWCALLVVLAPWLARCAARWPRSFAAAALALALGLLAHQRYALHVNPDDPYAREVAALALEVGARDAVQTAFLFPEPDRLWPIAEAARRAERFVFGRPPLRGLREALGAPCPSSREVALQAPPTLRPLAGDAAHVAVECTLAAATDLPAVRLADERGRAVGFALVAVRDGALPRARGSALAVTANGANGPLRAFAAR
jgi:hypothetical protein